MVGEHRQQLKVFLCHASGDKPAVRDLYKRLIAEGIDAWLDQERLLPGQDWRLEIPQAVRGSDVVVICLSKKSITKEGYVQKEIKFALDIAEEKPEGTIFLIPARLEDCTVPDRLNRWQWVDLFEENGFIKLLRSLKLRADAVGATIAPTVYVDSDEERKRRIEQLYTEGLAAFYTEDWDKACQRFQTILSEQPNHKSANEKLMEAERQRNLAKLYEQATSAVRSEDWESAIQTLEELSEKSADYKDAVQLLRNARKQKQLKELYAEAKALHAAQKWQAVLKVFEQISAIDPVYTDADELLPSAQKGVIELEQLAELNNQYSQALREMDAGNWYEARRLLETVHKSQIGYLETEKLLRKVENQILGEEEKRKQKDQISTLYEQAHGLLRSKKWCNALAKLEQIQKLDDQFFDTDSIAEKAQQELEREEQEAERQNKLAAMYAEAVRLLKEEKYQEAFDKWQEVKEIDPKYPDRQRVQGTARKGLANVKTINPKLDTIRKKSSLALITIGIIGLIVLIAKTPPITSFLSGIIIQTPTSQSTSTSTPLVPTSTPLRPTSTPEIHIQIRIITSSDWTQVSLIGGGILIETKKLSSSSQASVANFDSTTIYLNQPLERANGNNTVEMVVEATLTNAKSGTQLIFEGERGCIGNTTVELYNAAANPVLVKVLSWGGDCSGLNLHRFEVPVELFME
jgi:outer membrane protein assembly factor BamD (BamD/ComL family)